MYYTILARNSPISPGEGNVTIATQCATILKCCRMFCTVFVLLPSQHDADSSSARRKQPFSPNQDVCLSVYALFAPPCALRLCAPHSISRPVVAAENGHLFVSAWKGEEEREEREEETGGNLFLAAGFLEKHAAAAQSRGGSNVDKRGITLHPTDTGRAIEVNGCFFELELASALAVGARKWLLFYQSG